MNCRDTVRLLNGHVDAELDLISALAVEEHVEACPRCRALEGNLRSLRSAARRHAEFRAVPEALRERLQARYGSERAGGTARLRPWLAFAVPTFALLILAGWVGFASLNEERAASGKASARVVYHISQSDTAGAALRNLANHLEASPGVKVVVVAHNNGVDFLLRDARDESGQLYEAAVTKFKERGVDFRVCNNTLARRGIDASQVVPAATLVPSGIAEIGRLQSQEGYVYMRL